MREGWTYKKLGEVCESDLGKTLNSSKDTGEMRPYLCAINILWDKIDFTTLKQTRFEESELERYTVRKGDLLICEGGEIGRAAIWDKDYSIQYQNALHRVRFTDGVAPRFCLYFFMHLKKSGILDGRYGKGVTIKHLVKSSLMSIPIPVAPIENQLSIVAELDKINELMSLKKAQLSDLDSLAQSIFYDMFGDPIENEKEWEVKRLGEVCTIIAGGDKPKDISESPNGDYIYPVIANGEGMKGILGYSNKYRISNPSVTIGARGASIGNCRIVKENFTPVIRLITITPEENLEVTYLYFYAKQIRYNSNGAGQAQLTVPNIESEIIPIPPLSLQQEFAKRIELIEQQKAQISSTIKDLETLLASRMQYWFD